MPDHELARRTGHPLQTIRSYRCKFRIPCLRSQIPGAGLRRKRRFWENFPTSKSRSRLGRTPEAVRGRRKLYGLHDPSHPATVERSRQQVAGHCFRCENLARQLNRNVATILSHRTKIGNFFLAPESILKPRILTAPGRLMKSLYFVNRSKFTKGQTMQTYETLKHTTWGLQIPVVFILKYRSKGALRAIGGGTWGPVWRDLAG